MVEEKIKQSIELAGQKYPYASLFLDNPRFSTGLSLCDYFGVQKSLDNSWGTVARFDSGKNVICGNKVQVAGNEYDGSKGIWEVYLATRRDFLEEITTRRLNTGFTLEDMILIANIMRHEIREDTCREINPDNTYGWWHGWKNYKSVIPLLHDVVTVCYTAPADEKTQSYLLDRINYSKIESETGWSGEQSLLPFAYFFKLGKFANSHPEDQEVQQTFQRFRKRISEQLGKEVDQRFYGVLKRGTEWQCHYDEQKDERILREIGIAEDIITIGGSSSWNLQMLQDSLKNSLIGISSWLEETRK